MNDNEHTIMNAISVLKNKIDAGEIVEIRKHKTVEILNYQEVFTIKGDGIIELPEGFSTNKDYVRAELDWYDSMNPNGTQIAKHAQIWSTAADDRMMTNSNYGYLICSPQNGYQFNNVIKCLKKDKYSRRAVMYYTNPFMHFIGGNDHVCTLNVTYYIREDKLYAEVNMRSNDLRFGLVGADLAWQIHVLKKVHCELCLTYRYLKLGKVVWHATSLHVYERHFDLLHRMVKST